MTGVASRIIAALALAVVAGGFLFAQDMELTTSLPLGEVEVRLGMDADQVLSRLRGAYDVTQMDGNVGAWWISRKGGPPYRVVGSVGFTNQRLTFASRSWGPDADRQTAGSLAAALQDAVRALSGSGPPRCILSTNDNQPQWFQTVMECGPRRLAIITSPDGAFTTAVHEMIGGP